MLYNIYYITFSELLYNILIWLYNSKDGYTTHPNLPDEEALVIYIRDSAQKTVYSERNLFNMLYSDVVYDNVNSYAI